MQTITINKMNDKILAFYGDEELISFNHDIYGWINNNLNPNDLVEAITYHGEWTGEHFLVSNIFNNNLNRFIVGESLKREIKRLGLTPALPESLPSAFEYVLGIDLAREPEIPFDDNGFDTYDMADIKIEKQDSTQQQKQKPKRNNKRSKKNQ